MSSNKYPTHYASSLSRMNIDPKYGSHWIKNLNTLDTLDPIKQYRLYPTTSGTIANGRDYVALPANLVLTHEIKKKYNLS
jgi:hypothetical protein